MQKIIYAVMFAKTTVQPTGVEKAIDTKIPIAAHMTDSVAELIITPLKLLNTRIEDTVGKTIIADVKSDPTRFIARTITIAQTTDIMMLYSLIFIPDAAAKF